MRRTTPLLIGLAATSLTLAACGDDDGGGGGTATGTGSPAAEGGVVVVAESISGFDRDSYEATAGEVTITYEQGDSIPHTLVIDGIDEDTFKLEVPPDDEGSVELEPGEYTLFCDVPGHRSAGMEATLIVS